MKKRITKTGFKKTTIAIINLETIEQIKGGSSLPTDFDNNTFQENCPSHSK